MSDVAIPIVFKRRKSPRRLGKTGYFFNTLTQKLGIHCSLGETAATSANGDCVQTRPLSLWAWCLSWRKKANLQRNLRRHLRLYKQYFAASILAIIYICIFWRNSRQLDVVSFSSSQLFSAYDLQQCSEFENGTFFMTHQTGTAFTRFRDEYNRLGWQLSGKLETTTHVIGPFPMPGRKAKFDDEDVWQLVLKQDAEIMLGNIPRCLQLANTAIGLYGSLFPKEKFHELAGNLNFLHKTYLLSAPEQKASFLQQLECVNPNPHKNVWMFKPFESGQGHGIFFENDYMKIRSMLLPSPKVDPCSEDIEYAEKWQEMNQIPLGSNFLVQEYSTNPLLLDGQKFHFRTLALMACDEPTFVLYHDSYIFLSSKKFDLQVKDMSVHLSNTNVQKSVEGVRMEDLFWTMNDFQEYINENRLVKKGVKDMSTYVNKTLIPEMKEQLRQAFLIGRTNLVTTHHPRIHKFRMIAPDFMLDEDFNLKLIEINISGGLPDYNITKKREMQQTYISDIVSVMDSVFKRRLQKSDFQEMEVGHWQVILDTS